MERQKRKMKSKSKMAGVKSVFVIGDELLMTSFGDGDDAVLEKDIDENGVVNDCRNPAAYDAVYGTDSIRVKKTNNNIRAKVNNPLAKSNIRSEESALFRTRVNEYKREQKDKYETLFFGKTFDDNIHIQLISKILDIEKTFSVVIGNIVYAINNLSLEQSIDRPIDIFGDKNTQGISLREDNDYLKTMLPRCEYLFHNILNSDSDNNSKMNYNKVNKGKEEKDNRNNENIEKLKKALEVIKIIRVDSFHGVDGIKGDQKFPRSKYNLAVNYNEEIQKTISEPFNRKVEEVQQDFYRNSCVNIDFLKEIMYGSNYTDRGSDSLECSYFNFAILKQNKNMGFSITSIRECLLDLYELNFESMQNLRPRANSFCDFLIYDYYCKNESERANLVDCLRSAASEEEKKNIYFQTAERVKEKFRNAFNRISRFDASYIKNSREKNLSGGSSLPKYSFIEGFTKRSKKINDNDEKNADLFCNMLYYLAQFLDGKEINIFLTSIHNIFQNIDSFLKVMKEKGMECKFQKDFKMFSHAGHVAKKIEIVISLAKMKKTLDFYNAQALKDAVTILGVSKKHQYLDMNSYLDFYMFDNRSGATGKNAGKDHNLRNFLVSNVIRSRKFNYLSRYSNFAEVKKLAQNPSLVQFVLSRIEPSLICRYYESSQGISSEGITIDEQIKKLTGIIVDMNIDSFENINNGEIGMRYSKATPQSIERRNQMRVCVGLYLNVLYQIEKNLMNVNARYVLAFAFAERDALMLNFTLEECKKNKKRSSGGFSFIEMTQFFIDKKLFKVATEAIKKNVLKYNGNPESLNHIPGEYICKNMEGYHENTVRNFRNMVAHLTAVARVPLYISEVTQIDSYYALYHYCMQMNILQGIEQSGKILDNIKLKNALENARVHRTYSKDAVKYLCLPFAYNISRYKALTIKDLFDWTEYSCKKDE